MLNEYAICEASARGGARISISDSHEVMLLWIGTDEIDCVVAVSDGLPSSLSKSFSSTFFRVDG